MRQDTHRAPRSTPELLSARAPPLPGLRHPRAPGTTVLTVLPRHVTGHAPACAWTHPLRPPSQLRSLRPAVLGPLQVEDKTSIRSQGALGQKGEPARIPGHFTAGSRQEELKQAGTGGEGRELAEGVMAAVLWDHVPRGPALVLPVTCLQSSRSQRWRRDPPVTEAVAEAPEASGFQPLLGSVSKKRSGARPDPAHLLIARPGP